MSKPSLEKMGKLLLLRNAPQLVSQFYVDLSKPGRPSTTSHYPGGLFIFPGVYLL